MFTTLSAYQRCKWNCSPMYLKCYHTCQVIITRVANISNEGFIIFMKKIHSIHKPFDCSTQLFLATFWNKQRQLQPYLFCYFERQKNLNRSLGIKGIKKDEQVTFEVFKYCMCVIILSSLIKHHILVYIISQQLLRLTTLIFSCEHNFQKMSFYVNFCLFWEGGKITIE